MQFSQLPTLLRLAFAALGGKNSIPVASQLPGNINGASYTDGFPPATRTAIVAGGKPPAGLDVNGVLFDISSNIRWMNAGGPFPYSSAFATDGNVGGYPQGAQLMRADLTGWWINAVDNNATNPDATDGSAANWVPGYNYGVTPVAGLTNANVTLTPAQAAKNKITLAGALTGNVQIIFPTWTREWSVVNNTTGAFSVTAKTAGGSGVILAAGQQKITGDGVNITQPAESVAAATLPQHPVQLQQVGHGQCRLFVSTATALKLLPYNGNNVIVNGLPLQLPSAGVTLSNSGLSANAFYYIYLAGTTASPVLNASTTGYVTNTNGIAVKNGDVTQTLVGAVYMNASSQFSDSSNARYCMSYFNRQNKYVAQAVSSISFTNTSMAEISTGIRVGFITWSDESVTQACDGEIQGNTAGTSLTYQASIDGTGGQNGSFSGTYMPTANTGNPLVSNNGNFCTEGVPHYMTLLAAVNTGTGTLLQGYVRGMVRS